MSDNDPNPGITNPSPCPQDNGGHDELACELAWEAHCRRHEKREAEVRAKVKALELQIETLKNDLAGVINTKNEIRKEAYERGLTIIELESKLGIANRLLGEERERCAKIAATTEPFPPGASVSPLDGTERWMVRNMRERIAAAIRQEIEKRFCEIEIHPSPVKCGLPLPCKRHG